MIKVQLIVVQGKPEGKTIPLSGPVFRIGRDPDCQLRPSSDEISRHHAEIAIAGTTVTLKDMGSRNGTFLNGKAVKDSTVLKSGDLVKIAHLTFAVSIQGDGAGATTPSPSSGGSKSLDEVPPDEVANWLIADAKSPVPDRPSAVYEGDTITIDAYKGKSAPAPEPAAPKAEVKTPAPAPPPAPTPAPSPAPAPTPAPVAETDVDLGPVPLDDGPAPVPPQPPVPPKAETKKPSDKTSTGQVQGVGFMGSAPKSFYDELENIEFLPEGEGDSEPESYSSAGGGGSDEGDGEGSGSSSGEGSGSSVEEEWLDESNPFYVAKKKAQEAAPDAQAAKPSFKDSSEAANAILKKMLERRKAGGGGGGG
jgi:pSer/pThr/pTyr-binding forkhead associated (FHA) protein